MFRSAQVHFLHFLHYMHFVYFSRKKCALQKFRSQNKKCCALFNFHCRNTGRQANFLISFIPPYIRKSNKKIGPNNLQTCSWNRGWAPWKKCKKCTICAKSAKSETPSSLMNTSAQTETMIKVAQLLARNVCLQRFLL